MNENTKTKTVMTVAEAAQYLGLAESTLNKWRVYGEGPTFLKLGKAVRYRIIDLDAFLEEQQMSSTSEYGMQSGLSKGGR